MRDMLCAALVARSASADMVFLTGDLGFIALEPLRDAMGPRFINCGVAEQNMVSVAAALASEGLEVWVYSIAAFCYARPFEQIRNDICLHRLPVRLLGNGGGFGYGVMGATHHAVEDCGVLLTLPNMQVLVPAFDEDVAAVVAQAAASADPCYIRLGRGEGPRGYRPPAFAPWRRLLEGDGPVVLALGPLAGVALQALSGAGLGAELWAVGALPLPPEGPPKALRVAIAAGRPIIVYEEHVRHGGLGSIMATWILREGLATRAFRHLAIEPKAPVGRYGSQAFMRRENGIGPEHMLAAVCEVAGA